MKKDWMIKESELDDYQYRILYDTLAKSCIVSGSAGSGKSVLALIKAKRIQEEVGDDYQIIVYTKSLCHYMNSGRIELGLTKPFYYHWNWCSNKRCPKSDYVIVDEIQDFTIEEIKEFISSANKNFFFFGDTAQSIYEKFKNCIPVDKIGTTVLSARTAKKFELYYNYRLPIPVARFVQYVGYELPPLVEDKYLSKETSKPVILRCDTRQKQHEAIKRIIETNNLDDVAILLPKGKIAEEVYSALSGLGLNCQIRKDGFDFESSSPKIMTYHSSKGLQFETVIIPYAEDFGRTFGSDRKALYVAMTRTYRNLYVLYSGSMHAILSDIPQNLFETDESTASDLSDF